MAQQEPIRKRPAPTQEIPDKLYFRIGEVAKLCDVPAYVLRFWEGEFPQLKPNKGGTGQRLYRRRDVETALRVKTLLYDEGYTIPGARQALKTELRGSKEPQLALGIADTGPSTVDAAPLRKLQKDLRDLYTLLSKPPAKPSVQPIRGGRPAPAPFATRPAPKATVKAFPKPKTPSLYDSFDRLFDTLPESEPNES
ncbi:DNA-binding transcriptional regulator, MerR family [Granulicella rosea]|uniref:DNA-binding transcriptional regulator, MerR family n=1 Tax=Granulicella rosea TaxID=474952 RepID=A0A239D3I7_9BACT|nr:MerR family transcriptional regulator [Granulicella rosea]SNS27076.1 DNA-binding transcriptional regulator, MerR family [Granulicella rosea]